MKPYSSLFIKGNMGFALLLMLMGCATGIDRTFQDPSIPAAQQVQLKPGTGLTITACDDSKTKWNGGRMTVLSAGSHTLLIDYYEEDNNTRWWAYDMSITYDFSAGHTYRLDIKKEGDSYRPRYKLVITDVTFSVDSGTVSVYDLPGHIFISKTFSVPNLES